jgi:hypothetical protein
MPKYDATLEYDSITRVSERNGAGYYSLEPNN